MKFLFFIFLQITSPIEKLQKYIDSVQNDSDLKTGILAASIRSTVTGEYKIQTNAQKSVNSASTLKLVSTATALSLLSPNYKYQTFIEYDGDLIDGVLKGNVYIRGTGDPSLGSSRVGLDFQQTVALFAKQIKDFGIKKIDGYIIGDGSIYPENSLSDTWVWGDIGNYYGAGVSGLNVNENLYQIYFKAGNFVGDKATIQKISPELPNFTTTNYATTFEKGSGDNIIIYNTPFSNHLLIEGTIPLTENDFPVKGAIHDPATLFAYHIQKKYIELGGEISTQTIGFKQLKTTNYIPLQRYIIYTQDSPALSVLAQHCNYQSINLYADAFMKSVGYAIKKDARFDASVEATKQLLQQKGIDLQGFMIRDGSGLSPSGVLTANNLTDILFSMRSDYAFNELYNSIPIVGVNGTVQNLCKGTKAAGNVRAKSGSISNTRAYSGYFTATNGELMSFTFIINRYADGADRKIRKILEQMMILMVEI